MASLTRRRLLAAALGSLASAPLRSLAAGTTGVTVFAAASLTEALEAVAQRFRAQGGMLRLVFGSSALLARQIEQGAAADVFASADVEWMDYLAERNLIDVGSRRDVLSNRLVLIGAAGSPLRLAPAPRFPLLAALGARGRLALADPDYVPAGRYARAALTSLGVWSAVADRLARAENVRAALALVARGEAPLGIVYATDARVEARVRVLGTFAADAHPPIVYPFARLARARSAAAGRAFEFLVGPQAAVIYRRHGFVVLA